MSQALSFSLVSPERELFAGDAQSVTVPGTEGLFEVQPGHAPVMSTLSPGLLVIREGSAERKFFVRGGFADVTSAGLTVLAETAIPENELKGTTLAREKDLAEEIIRTAEAAQDVMNAERAKAALSAY